MSKTLIIGSEEFDFPLQGENPDWGEQVTDWAEAVSDSLKSVQQPNDLLRSIATINNNVTTFTNISGFNFDTAEVRTINAEYIIKRTAVSPAANLVESGFIQGNFDGTNWNMVRRQVGDAGIEFDITPAGQVQYTTTNLTGSSYAGSIIFRAKVFNENE
jgi:uncharacterized protein YjbI with pentapeptide repeats